MQHVLAFLADRADARPWAPARGVFGTGRAGRARRAGGVGRSSWAAAGFSLVELVVALAVLSIVMAVALPAMGEFSASNQLAAARSSFVTSVALARTEAAKLGLQVLVQAEAGGVTGNAFREGWAVVVDSDGDGQAGASEPRVRRWPALPIGVTLDGDATLAFQPTGALVNAADAVYLVCRAVGSAQGFAVTVTPSGVADVATSGSCP